MTVRSPIHFQGTTILSVRRARVVMGGDGQVSLGNTVMKGNACKVRRMRRDQILAGFAGGTADAIPRVSVLNLPFDYPGGESSVEQLRARLGLERGDFILFIGSLEPRKNFIGLLEGFERYRMNDPASKTRLVLVGSTGWKNSAIERTLKTSPVADSIVRTGCVDGEHLNV